VKHPLNSAGAGGWQKKTKQKNKTKKKQTKKKPHKRGHAKQCACALFVFCALASALFGIACALRPLKEQNQSVRYGIA
jgi:hypothetical protein